LKAREVEELSVGKIAHEESQLEALTQLLAFLFSLPKEDANVLIVTCRCFL
jgi:hypothetical protein